MFMFGSLVLDSLLLITPQESSLKIIENVHYVIRLNLLMLQKLFIHYKSLSLSFSILQPVELCLQCVRYRLSAILLYCKPTDNLFSRANFATFCFMYLKNAVRFLNVSLYRYSTLRFSLFRKNTAQISRFNRLEYPENTVMKNTSINVPYILCRQYASNLCGFGRHTVYIK